MVIIWLRILAVFRVHQSQRNAQTAQILHHALNVVSAIIYPRQLLVCNVLKSQTAAHVARPQMRALLA
jgi:hypothetical protein